ncbi:MAG TPA: heme-binding protein [Micropepsaceae bacterium]|nr:heme-binding protein [Micropepsaceae bacterium]
MPVITKSLMVLGAALALATSAYAASGPIVVHDMSLDMAKAAAEATLSECRSKGFHTAAVVVDRAGQVIVTLRDELATSQMTEMSRRKAYTARMFRRSTLEWAKRTHDDPSIAAQRDLPDVLALAGGVPIKMGEETIGAVGSAGSTLEQDDTCARTGAAKAEAMMK